MINFVLKLSLKFSINDVFFDSQYFLNILSSIDEIYQYLNNVMLNSMVRPKNMIIKSIETVHGKVFTVAALQVRSQQFIYG